MNNPQYQLTSITPPTMSISSPMYRIRSRGAGSYPEGGQGTSIGGAPQSWLDWDGQGGGEMTGRARGRHWAGMSAKVFYDENENGTRQKEAIRTTATTQGIMNNPQYQLTKANHVLLLLEMIKAWLTKKLTARTVLCHTNFQYQSVNSKTKIY